MESPQVILKITFDLSILDLIIPHYIRWLNFLCERKDWGSVFERIDHGFLWILPDLPTLSNFLSTLPLSFSRRLIPLAESNENPINESLRTHFHNETNINIHIESINYPILTFVDLFKNFFHDLDRSIGLCLLDDSIVLVFPGMAQILKYVEFIQQALTFYEKE